MCIWHAISVVYLKIFNVLGAVTAGSPSEPLAREEAEVEAICIPEGGWQGVWESLEGLGVPRGACPPPARGKNHPHIYSY